MVGAAPVGWGDGFRSRLRDVVGTYRSQAEFARAIGTSSSNVTAWLAGTNLPTCEHLRAIADARGVSLDWLFFEDAPMMRGTSRSEQTLAAEFSAHVARELLHRVRVGDFALPDTTATALLRVPVVRGRAPHRTAMAKAMLANPEVAGDVLSLPAAVEHAADAFRVKWAALAELLATALEFSDSTKRVQALRALVKRTPGRTRLSDAALALADEYERISALVLARHRLTIRQVVGQVGGAAVGTAGGAGVAPAKIVGRSASRP